MIVRKPIGPLKIQNTLYRLSVGKLLPEAVVKFYTENGQLESLIKHGVIEGKIEGGKNKTPKEKRHFFESVSESKDGQSEDPE